MIQVNFNFEVKIMPLLAFEIEKSINAFLQNHPQMDHSLDAIIGIEYRSVGNVWLDIPLMLPLELINQILIIVFAEFRQRQLIPGM